MAKAGKVGSYRQRFALALRAAWKQAKAQALPLITLIATPAPAPLAPTKAAPMLLFILALPCLLVWLLVGMVCAQVRRDRVTRQVRRWQAEQDKANAPLRRAMGKR